MKANLYNEEAPVIEPVDEQQLATANEKPAPVDCPRQGHYIVDYKTVGKATLIALVIFLVWIAAEFFFV